MKKILSAVLAAVMILTAMVSLTSCKGPKDAGAEISVYLGNEVYDFDPTDYYVDSNAEQLMSLLYEPLFKINSKGELKCAAAKDYKVNKEDRTIVINLRETYWSNEEPVTAEDFVYAWRDIIIEPKNANPAAVLFYDIENAFEIKSGVSGISLYDFGVEANGKKITIKYREGADYKQLLKNLASVATSPVYYNAVKTGAGYWSKSTSTIVTNGPFRISELNYGTGDFTLMRNLGYHQKTTEKHYTDQVTPNTLVQFVVDGEEVTLSYDLIANKTVFYMSDAPLEDRAANKSKAKVTDDLSTYTYVFNFDNPLFQIKEVRQALSLALDRDAMVEAITFGKAATGFLPDPVAKNLYGKTISDRLASESEAAELLAGVDFTGIDKSFTLTINDDEESEAMANIAKAAWEALGFKVNIKKVSTVTSTVTGSNGEKTEILDSEIQALVKAASLGERTDKDGNAIFDIIALDWQMYSTDAFVSLAAFSSHMNGNGAVNGVARANITGWSSIDFDQCIDRAYTAKNKEDRKTALKAAEQILLDSCVVIPVVYNQSFAFVSKDLSNVSYDAYGNFSLTKATQKNYRKYLDKED